MRRQQAEDRAALIDRGPPVEVVTTSSLRHQIHGQLRPERTSSRSGRGGAPHFASPTAFRHKQTFWELNGFVTGTEVPSHAVDALPSDAAPDAPRDEETLRAMALAREHKRASRQMLLRVRGTAMEEEAKAVEKAAQQQQQGSAITPLPSLVDQFSSPKLRQHSRVGHDGMSPPPHRSGRHSAVGSADLVLGEFTPSVSDLFCPLLNPSASAHGKPRDSALLQKWGLDFYPPYMDRYMDSTASPAAHRPPPRSGFRAPSSSRLWLPVDSGLPGPRGIPGSHGEQCSPVAEEGAARPAHGRAASAEPPPARAPPVPPPPPPPPPVVMDPAASHVLLEALVTPTASPAGQRALKSLQPRGAGGGGELRGHPHSTARTLGVSQSAPVLLPAAKKAGRMSGGVVQRATAASQHWDEPLKEPLDELRDEPLPRTRKQRLILAKQALDAGGFELPRVASRTRIASLPALPLLEPVAGAACRGRHRVRGASRGEHRSTAFSAAGPPHLMPRLEQHVKAATQHAPQHAPQHELHWVQRGGRGLGVEAAGPASPTSVIQDGHQHHAAAAQHQPRRVRFES